MSHLPLLPSLWCHPSFSSGSQNLRCRELKAELVIHLFGDPQYSPILLFEIIKHKATNFYIYTQRPQVVKNNVQYLEGYDRAMCPCADDSFSAGSALSNATVYSLHWNLLCDNPLKILVMLYCFAFFRSSYLFLKWISKGTPAILALQYR